MAEIIKFHEKNVALFGKIETTSGVYNAPIATDALPATSLTGSTTLETGSYEYLGSDLSRDEYTYTKDIYADVSLETIQQVLDVLDPARTVANVPMSQWLQSCGGFVTVDVGDGSVTIDNGTVSNSSLTIDYRKTSSQDTVTQKLIKFTACRGMVDINADLGEVPKLTFAYKGNSSNPLQSPIVTPNFGAQTSAVSASVRQATIVNADIAPLGEPFAVRAALPGSVTSITRVGAVATVTMSAPHLLATGRRVRISGASDPLYNGDFQVVVTGGSTYTYTMQATPASNATGTLVAQAGGYSKNFCFGTLNAPNFFGFDYSRYLTGCEEGFSKKAIPTDVTVSMLEDIASEFAIQTITRVGAAATVTAANHRLVSGEYVRISGATDPLYNGTYVVNVSNGNTFTYTMLGTPGADAAGTLIGLNTQSTKFDPDANLTEFFTARVKFGTRPGRYVTYQWDKLQLANVVEGKIGELFSRDVTFRNTGVSYIILE